MPNLSKKNNDVFAIKKKLSKLGYKPIECFSDSKNQNLSKIHEKIKKMIESSKHNSSNSL